MRKSGSVSRQRPRSSPTTLNPASASSFARMVPLKPTPTTTASTGFSFVAMVSPFSRAGCASDGPSTPRSEEHTSELQSRFDLVCRLLLEKKKKKKKQNNNKSKYI